MRLRRLSCALTALTIAMVATCARTVRAGEPDATAAADDAAARARALYEEGQAHVAKRDWARAREAYLAAWKLKKHYQIAGNLGQVEAELGMHRDAAEHLHYYIHHSPKDDPPPDSARTKLYEVELNVGQLVIHVFDKTTEIVVDGQVLGTRATMDVVTYVEPGRHTVEARLGGRSVSEVVTAVEGVLRQVVLRFPEPEEPPPGAMTLRPRGDAVAPVQEEPPRDQAPEKSTAAIAVGMSTAGVGIVVGIVMTSLASRESDQADELRVGDGDPSACYAQGTEACNALSDAVSSMDTFTGVAVTSFAIGGAALAGTIAYVLWPEPVEPQETPAAIGVRAAPWVGPTGGGIGVRGRF